jgi:hypothetical protein
MASDEAPREERRRMTTRQWTGPERRSRFAAGAGGQLLERGDGVGDPVGSLGDAADVFSIEGEPGANIGGRYGGPAHEGGFGTLAGGIYKGEGSSDDAPSYGDWIRHGTGATSGALGHEGSDFEGEGTWGEVERKREQADDSESTGGDQ